MKNTHETILFMRKHTNVSGVYAITCDQTQRAYVGSSNNIYQRIRIHFIKLGKNKHCNKELQNDFNKYGVETFHVELLEETHEYDLLNKENEWCNKGCNLYNSSMNANHSSIKDITVKQFYNFWKRVDIKLQEECWNWKGKCIDKDGYARITITINNKEISFRANRLAYFWLKPDDNENLIVRHTCNNKSCCNPHHMVLGSYSENRKDVVKDKGTILSEEQVKILRNKFKENYSIPRLELVKFCKDKFNLDLELRYIMHICSNRFYYDKNYILGNWKSNKHQIIDPEIIKYIRYNTSNLGYYEVSPFIKEKFGITLTDATCSNIKKNKTHIHI